MQLVMWQRLIAAKNKFAYTPAMPRAIPTPQTTETLSHYCQRLESQLVRMRSVLAQMEAAKIQTMTSSNDDSFHVALKKLGAFNKAIEESLTIAILASSRTTVEDSLQATEKLEKTARSKRPRKRKSSD